MRETVLDSWRRSLAAHVHPDRVDLPFVREPSPDSPLTLAATPVLRRLADDLAMQSVSVILTTADGVVLDRIATDATIMNALDSVRLARGYSYAENYVGTNGIGTAIETGRPTYIEGGEHYLGTLGRLACAGAPIRHPISGKVLGVLDLTCWALHSDPLLLALAKSASSQIEDRLDTLSNENENAVLDAYLRHCRRYPLGVVAIGGEVVLMNRHLRHVLDARDQVALLEHASDLSATVGVRTALAPLPSGRTSKIVVAERNTVGSSGHTVFHVHLAADPAIPGATRANARGGALPGVVGRSSAWRRCCEQVERCFHDRDWVVLDGERGTGRFKLIRSVAQNTAPYKHIRIYHIEEFRTGEEFLAAIEEQTDDESFQVAIANIDGLPPELLDGLADVLQACQGRGWVAATIDSSDSHASRVEALLLPFFTHTVSVAPLRHRIEDLEDLVPQMLRELTKGADVRLSSAALRQLSKLPWPGNVAQLRRILAETVARQRSGVIDADKLPPECHALSRRKLTQLESIERDAIVRSLRESGGGKSAAATALGMSRATIYRKIKEYGIT